MEDTKDICLKLSHIKTIYRSSELEYCENNPDISYAESKLIITDDTKFEYTFDESLKLILNPNYPEKILLEFHKDKKKKSNLVNWDPESKKISKPRLVSLEEPEIKDFLEAGNGKLSENQSALFVISSSSPKTYILVFPDKYIAKLRKMKLFWDTRQTMESEEVSDKSQLKEFFWQTMVPIGFLVDVITYPFQVIGGFIYIMIFGIK